MKPTDQLPPASPSLAQPDMGGGDGSGGPSPEAGAEAEAAWGPFMQRCMRQHIAGLRQTEVEDLRTEHELQERYLAAFFALPPDRTSGTRFFQALSTFIRKCQRQRHQRRRRLQRMVLHISRCGAPPSPHTPAGLASPSSPPRTPPQPPVRPAASPPPTPRQPILPSRAHEECALMYGNVSLPLGAGAYRWVVYVREGCGIRPSSIVRKVMFQVPLGVQEPTIRSVTRPPFCLAGLHTAEFDCRLTIFFHNRDAPALHISHRVGDAAGDPLHPGLNHALRELCEEAAAGRRPPPRTVVNEYVRLVYLPKTPPSDALCSSAPVVPPPRPSASAPGGDDRHLWDPFAPEGGSDASWDNNWGEGHQAPPFLADVQHPGGSPVPIDCGGVPFPVAQSLQPLVQDMNPGPRSGFTPRDGISFCVPTALGSHDPMDPEWFHLC